MEARSAARPHRTDTGSLIYNLGAICLLVAFLGLGLAYAIDAARRSAQASPNAAQTGETLTRTIGGKDLEIPADWFRYAEQRVEGFAKQVDLRFALPLGPRGATRSVDVTLLPRSAVRPSAGLLDGVYLHMFEPGELAGPRGLIGKPLKPTEGYQKETVWYDPLSGNPFVAKCSAAVAPQGEQRCLRAIHLAPGIGAVYAFDFELLDNWKAFDAQLNPLLERMGVFKP